MATISTIGYKPSLSCAATRKDHLRPIHPFGTPVRTKSDGALAEKLKTSAQISEGPAKLCWREDGAA